jgi:transposase
MTRNAILQELEATRARLREREADLARERAERQADHDRLAAAQAEIARLMEENAELHHRVDVMARRMYGRSSERLSPDQLLLAFEAAREEEARRVEEDRLETALGEETPATPRPRRRRPSQKKAHANLPVREVHVELPEADRVCGCGESRCRIGEEVSEQIDYVPASLHVVRTIRGKYACPSCQEGVVTAPLPPQGLERSVAAPGLVAHVVASKYADHLPLYRQEEIFARAGVDLPRSTLGDLVAQAAVRLAPVARAVLASVLAGRVVHTDDTPVTYLLQPRGRATGAVWVYVGEKGEAAYDFTETRSRDGPAAVLRSYRGYLQADALKVYDAIFAPGAIVEVACWAHVRRYFFDALGSERERATEMLGKIRRLYAVEARARVLDEPDRVLMRLEHARPVLAEIHAWLEDAAAKVLPKGPLGQAIAYARSNWPALQRYLEHGYLDIDNNEAERALRGVAVGRKNWLFAGSAEAGRRAAVLMTLVATCKLQGVEPEAYLADALVRVNTTPMSRIKDLTPRGWKRAREAAFPAAGSA